MGCNYSMTPQNCHWRLGHECIIFHRFRCYVFATWRGRGNPKWVLPSGAAKAQFRSLQCGHGWIMKVTSQGFMSVQLLIHAPSSMSVLIGVFHLLILLCPLQCSIMATKYFGLVCKARSWHWGPLSSIRFLLLDTVSFNPPCKRLALKWICKG